MGLNFLSGSVLNADGIYLSAIRLSFITSSLFPNRDPDIDGVAVDRNDFLFSLNFFVLNQFLSFV